MSRMPGETKGAPLREIDAEDAEGFDLAPLPTKWQSELH